MNRCTPYIHTPAHEHLSMAVVHACTACMSNMLHCNLLCFHNPGVDVSDVACMNCAGCTQSLHVYLITTPPPAPPHLHQIQVITSHAEHVGHRVPVGRGGSRACRHPNPRRGAPGRPEQRCALPPPPATWLADPVIRSCQSPS